MKIVREKLNEKIAKKTDSTTDLGIGGFTTRQTYEKITEKAKIEWNKWVELTFIGQKISGVISKKIQQSSNIKPIYKREKVSGVLIKDVIANPYYNGNIIIMDTDNNTYKISLDDKIYFTI
jgi:hypothetical protein